MPAYCTGISQPANGTSFAPAATWRSWSGRALERSVRRPCGPDPSAPNSGGPGRWAHGAAIAACQAGGTRRPRRDGRVRSARAGAHAPAARASASSGIRGPGAADGAAVIASNASATATMPRAERDLASPREARPGSRCRPSARGDARTSSATAPSAGAAAMMRSPASGWRRMNAHSSSVSGPGLARISSGIATLPTSCSSAAWRTTSSSSRSRPSRRAVASASAATASPWPPSSGSRSDSAPQQHVLALARRPTCGRRASARTCAGRRSAAPRRRRAPRRAA